MWDRLMSLDKRVIYLLVAIAIAVPLVKPLGLPLSTSTESETGFNAVDALKPGDVLWIGADYGPSSAPELDPMAIAIFRQALKKGVKVVIYAMWQDGVQMSKNWTEKVSKEVGAKEGVDWVNLGWKPNNPVTLRQMTDDLWGAAAGVDVNGTPLSQLPLMERVKKLDSSSVAFIFDLSTGSPGTADYLQYVSEPKKVPMSVGVTAVSAPGAMPYVKSGQYKGILSGMRGAAEYELLTKAPGSAIKGMDAQSLGHALIILLIIVGNVGYVLRKKA